MDPLPIRGASRLEACERATLVRMLKVAGLLAVSALAVVGACCAVLLRDVPDELPDVTVGDRAA